MEDMGGEEILNVFKSLPFRTRLSSTSVGGCGAMVVHLAGTANIVLLWLLVNWSISSSTRRLSVNIKVNTRTTTDHRINQVHKMITDKYKRFN